MRSPIEHTLWIKLQKSCGWLMKWMHHLGPTGIWSSISPSMRWWWHTKVNFALYVNFCPTQFANGGGFKVWCVGYSKTKRTPINGGTAFSFHSWYNNLQLLENAHGFVQPPRSYRGTQSYWFHHQIGIMLMLWSKWSHMFNSQKLWRALAPKDES